MKPGLATATPATRRRTRTRATEAGHSGAAQGEYSLAQGKPSRRGDLSLARAAACQRSRRLKAGNGLDRAASPRRELSRGAVQGDSE